MRVRDALLVRRLQVVPLNGQAPRSVVLGANHQELELHIPNQHVLCDVTCGR
jgi:hypothetical protein